MVETNSSMLPTSGKRKTVMQTEMDDGRIAINIMGYSLFAAKKLDKDQIAGVREELSKLDSLIQKRKDEDLSDEEKQQLRSIAMNLGKTYKISNITSRDVSMIVPNIEKGVKVQKR